MWLLNGVDLKSTNIWTRWKSADTFHSKQLTRTMQQGFEKEKGLAQGPNSQPGSDLTTKMSLPGAINVVTFPHFHELCVFALPLLAVNGDAAEDHSVTDVTRC